MMLRSTFSRLGRTPRRLARDTSGVALLEFAFGMPLVLMLGLYGIEVANQALMNLKISQIALSLADNASRVGVINNSNIENLREVDMNDVLQAARKQGEAIELTTRGRIIVSSLEKNNAGVQRIHWQRCIGQKSGASYDSSYGTTTTTAGTDTTAGNAGTLAPSGMGDAGKEVSAPTNGGVMFVEINYDYKPVVGLWLMGTHRIHYIASFIVRDNRDFVQIYNPSPAATRSTCNLYPA
jgi:Flp pilus assembly protein TadG